MIHPVATQVHIPAGMVGPDPMDYEVRCFLIDHRDGLLLVDTGLAETPPLITAKLAAIGATWSDVTDVVLTHEHPDHVGGLADVRSLASRATVWASAHDRYEGEIRPVEEGQGIRGLSVLETPGHTPGHLCLIFDDEDILLVGDALGTMHGELYRAPAVFTADPVTAEKSLHRIAQYATGRVVFSHGAEIADPGAAIRTLLG
ncbi:MBL fold metallo-hydrolase [Streptosporangiaceae bacterium NEAU-GS5]|nr:MBL fold metallo-hydrolase [Streptosporangiaceae bacterium NEAU-GS5]